VLDATQGNEVPPRLYDDDYWRAQPPLGADGAPELWEMWSPALQRHAAAATASSSSSAPRAPDADHSRDIVGTAQDFVESWDSRRNFLFAPDCPPIAQMRQFEFPPTEAIVDAMLALDSTVAIPARRREQTEYAEKDHNQLEHFRSLPRDEFLRVHTIV
jgi:hypothetical protein